MQKKIIAFILCVALVTSCAVALASCNKSSDKDLIAIVTDIGDLNDGGFNQNTYEGVKSYAEEHGLRYAYYHPNVDSDGTVTNSGREEAMRKAIADGAKIIVAPGDLQKEAIKKVAKENPSVKFVYVDGTAIDDLQNVTAISFKEEESGFIAGYSVAKEGFDNLGGTFGGGGTYAACNRFAYGYVQGIIAATSGKRNVFVKISFKYGENFNDSAELKAQMTNWYSEGVEVIFSCGGDMLKSVIEAAEEFSVEGEEGYTNEKHIIGVDVDQSSRSDRIITSAIKRLDEAVKHVLALYYGGEWDAKLANKTSNLGANENATGIPDNPWRFNTYTVAEYYDMYDSMKAGTFNPLSNVPEDCNDVIWWNERVADLNAEYGSYVVVNVEI
ncbi:MAG: BMP family ABC transporter substrate-binding protein [Clostridia bacterium]|nr:BMP family ABC transporter substrate-binding protein [Clostridia bacterium]